MFMMLLLFSVYIRSKCYEIVKYVQAIQILHAYAVLSQIFLRLQVIDWVQKTFVFVFFQCCVVTWCQKFKTWHGSVFWCLSFHKTRLDLRPELHSVTTETFAQFRKLMTDGCSSFMLTLCKIGIEIKKDCNY